MNYLQVVQVFSRIPSGSVLKANQQLIVDDLFLAKRITAEAAEVLQAIVHQRYKLRCPLVVTSNRVVQDWCRCLGNVKMTSTSLDWLMHPCTMLEFDGKSYRLKEAEALLGTS